MALIEVVSPPYHLSNFLQRAHSLKIFSHPAISMYAPLNVLSRSRIMKYKLFVTQSDQSKALMANGSFPKKSSLQALDSGTGSCSRLHCSSVFAAANCLNFGSTLFLEDVMISLSSNVLQMIPMTRVLGNLL